MPWNGASGPKCWNGTSDIGYFLIYHTYHVFGLYDNNYVTHIYDKYDWKKVYQWRDEYRTNFISW